MRYGDAVEAIGDNPLPEIEDRGSAGEHIRRDVGELGGDGHLAQGTENFDLYNDALTSPSALGDSSMVFDIEWWIESIAVEREVVDRVNSCLQRALDVAGIETPYPMDPDHFVQVLCDLAERLPPADRAMNTSSSSASKLLSGSCSALGPLSKA